MFKFLNLFRNKPEGLGHFHPDSPVLPEQPVDIESVEVFRRENFPDAGPASWLDRDDAMQSIAALVAAGTISQSDAELCRKWVTDGYVILKKYFFDEYLDQVWSDYNKAIEEGHVEPEPLCEVNKLPGRFLNPHFKVESMKTLLQDAGLNRLVSLFFGAKSIPFQTIAGHNGSQQGDHSDAIHMTSYPMDYLAASWTAFEDINAECGPLVYYPGSHRIPHFLSREAGISVDDFNQRSYEPYHEKYEPGIKRIIDEHNLTANYFLAEKGDVLIWHSNLIHGGSKRKDLQYSRKAFVCHYFAEGCITYHDLAGRKTRLHRKP